MKKLWKWMVAATFLMGFTAHGRSAEIFKNDDLDLYIGGRLQELGELSYTSDDTLRDKLRIYLFSPEDRLFSYGTFKGYKWNFEVAFGGEAINSSNNQLNLKEFSADVPLIPDMAYFKVGQFKVPTNLESAVYEGNQLFTEKSELMNMFFNTGYDNGLALYGTLGNLDLAGGVLSACPNLPQRYLPELFQIPPMLFARIGFDDGIKADIFHQKQTGFDKPGKTEFGVHLNGQFVKDSNAGHSTDLSLDSSNIGTFSANGDYGNMMLYSLFNPYLGKGPAGGYSQGIDSYYWQAGLDFQLRAPMGDTTFTLTGEALAAQFNNTGFAPMTINGNVQTSGSLNIGGAEVIASVGDNPWEIAGRFVAVIPDAGFKTVIGATTNYTSVTGSDPIYEVTLPSITWHMNEDCKLVGEAIWAFNTPEVKANDGVYVLTEMPSQAASSLTPPTILPRASLIPSGRMMFQFQF